MSAASFFEPRGDDVFLATEATRGPWDARLMHGGPPSALLARAFERLVGDDAAVARMTVEFVKPLVIGELRIAASLVRPGRKVRIAAGSLTDANGVEIVRATALAIRRGAIDAETDSAAPGAPPPLPPVADSAPWQFPFFRQATGYHTSMELRVARGTFGTGAMAGWMRMRIPLVPGETPSGLQRAVCAADSGNGLSVALDLARFTFLNPDLVVALHRHPDGEWIGMDSTTVAHATGIGLAESALSDERGPIGRAVQTLIVESRGTTGT